MPLQPLWIRGKVVEDVEDYRYLGVVNRLDWKKQTLFLEEAKILQRVQQDVGDLSPVCCCQRHFLCCCVLGQ